jgi:DNA-binding PadR family transcriptional regulator
MSIKHVVLGVLSAGELHGYAVHERARSWLGSAATNQPARTYAALAELERDALIAVVAEAQADRPGRGHGRRHFRLTEGGRRELARWLAASDGTAPLLRRELLVKLIVAARSGEARVRAVVAAERAVRLLLERRLSAVGAAGRRRNESARTKAADSSGTPSSVPDRALVDLLARRRELAHLRAELRYLGELAAELPEIAGGGRPGVKPPASASR